MARDPTQAPPLIRTWWPRAFPVPPQLTIADRTDPADVFMLRPLAQGVTVPASADDVFYWRSDYF
jgi:hypothetical protein